MTRINVGLALRYVKVLLSSLKTYQCNLKALCFSSFKHCCAMRTASHNVNNFWSIKNSSDVIKNLRLCNFQGSQVSSCDFSTLHLITK